MSSVSPSSLSSAQSAPMPRQGVTPSGWMLFAAVMILISGVFNVFDGLFGFFRSLYYVGHPIGGSIWIWALCLLALGVAQVLAGLAIAAGQSWARWFGIVVVSLNLFLHLLVVALYPWWSLTIIAIDVLIIYALTAGWRPVAPEEQPSSA